MLENKPLPLISIALCTYNGEKFLAQQIESLLAQDYPNFEIIICDDRSSDRTLEIAERFKSPKVFIHSNTENVGFNKNFERAFKLCRGDFIAPCDQDDIWLPGKLTVLVESIGSNMLAYCNSEFIDAESASLGMRLSDLKVMYSGKDPRPFILENCVAGHASLFRRELLNHVMPIPDVRFFDWWIAYAAAAYGGVIHIDRCLVKYRQHLTSQTDVASLKPKPKNQPLARLSNDKKLVWMSQLSRIQHGESIAILDKLRPLVKARSEQYFCFSLPFLLFRERHTLLFMLYAKPGRPLLFILQSLFGYKFLRLFNPQKYSGTD